MDIYDATFFGDGSKHIQDIAALLSHPHKMRCGVAATRPRASRFQSPPGVSGGRKDFLTVSVHRSLSDPLLQTVLALVGESKDTDPAQCRSVVNLPGGVPVAGRSRRSFHAYRVCLRHE